MLYDTTATNAAFANGRPPEDIFEILEWAKQQTDSNRESDWRLISARRRFGKILFEIEETTTAGPRRLIGKLGKAERATTLFDTLVLLRSAGFEPPARLPVSKSTSSKCKFFKKASAMKAATTSSLTEPPRSAW